MSHNNASAAAAAALAHHGKICFNLVMTLK